MSINDFAEMIICLICFSIYTKLQHACKNWQENAFMKKCQMTLCFVFYTENQNSHQNGGKTIFDKKWKITTCIPLQVEIFIEITLLHTFSEINAFNEFYTEIQDGHQNGVKMIRDKTWQITLRIPCRSKFSSKSLYFTMFP